MLGDWRQLPTHCTLPVVAVLHTLLFVSSPSHLRYLVPWTCHIGNVTLGMEHFRTRTTTAQITALLVAAILTHGTVVLPLH